MKNLKAGTVIGSGGRSALIEKVNSENIYIRQPIDRTTGLAPLRIIPYQVVAEIYKAVQEGRIGVNDIANRKFRHQNDLPHLFDELDLEFDKFILGYASSIANICTYLLENRSEMADTEPASTIGINLPKPFILLAGVSGTGKTRFVKEQAEATANGRENYRLVPVRPDWHEPSDLLGYITRIESTGPRYVVTDVLKFIVSAWKEAAAGTDDTIINLKPDYVPFWLCLDEMNLAPVEQYFADYLSVLETRKWQDGTYTCEPLLNSTVIQQLETTGLSKLRKDLGLEGDEYTALWELYCKYGISIPPNLIVAGTVNMDETTHGFSRKVIDRALTFDFGEFFPNNYQQFLDKDSQPKPKILGHSVVEQASIAALSEVKADPDGRKSINFLESVNSILKDTSFELAYRALNELLLAVICFRPQSATELQAVWDDFMMTKVLPRIEGDRDKLQTRGGELLEKLTETLRAQLSEFPGDRLRPDLLRTGVEEGVPVRSIEKLDWMNERLLKNGFTAFWP